jgi:hypothetical protein
MWVLIFEVFRSVRRQVKRHVICVDGVAQADCEANLGRKRHDVIKDVAVDEDKVVDELDDSRLFAFGSSSEPFVCREKRKLSNVPKPINVPSSKSSMCFRVPFETLSLSPFTIRARSRVMRFQPLCRVKGGCSNRWRTPSERKMVGTAASLVGAAPRQRNGLNAAPPRGSRSAR